MLDYIGLGRAEGGRVMAGGEAGAGAGFVRPTVFADVRPDARIVRERSSARWWWPSPSTRWTTRCAWPATVFGLGASIWSNDLSRVQRLIPRIAAGTVWVNTHNMLDPNMPFGGFKQSGIGREHGRAVMDMYLEKKSVCIAY